MTGFTPEEWRTAARIARRSIFTEGRPDLADAWDKAADQAEARLIPAVTDIQILMASARKSGIGANAADRLREKFGSATLGSDSNSHRRTLGSVSGPGSAPTEPGPEVFLLTAEQVEDVRTLVGHGGSDYAEAFNRLRALLPATEPAEEVKPIKFRKMTAKYATANFGFPDVTDPCAGFIYTESAGKWTPYVDSDGGKWAWNGNQWELHSAPVEPAEEETKADPFKALHDVITFSSMDFGSASDVAWMYGIVIGWDNDDPDEGEHPHAAMWSIAQRFNWPLRKVEELRNLRAEWIRRTSSPVVPAPTETGPWQTWQEVPEGVKYYGINTWGPTYYVNRGGVRHRVFDDTPSKTADYIVQGSAPFVAAEEG